MCSENATSRETSILPRPIVPSEKNNTVANDYIFFTLINGLACLIIREIECEHRT